MYTQACTHTLTSPTPLSSMSHGGFCTSKEKLVEEWVRAPDIQKAEAHSSIAHLSSQEALRACGRAPHVVEPADYHRVGMKRHRFAQRGKEAKLYTHRSGRGQARPAASTRGPSTRSPAETSAIPNLPETSQAIHDSLMHRFWRGCDSNRKWEQCPPAEKIMNKAEKGTKGR